MDVSRADFSSWQAGATRRRRSIRVLCGYIQRRSDFELIDVAMPDVAIVHEEDGARGWREEGGRPLKTKPGHLAAQPIWCGERGCARRVLDRDIEGPLVTTKSEIVVTGRRRRRDRASNTNRVSTSIGKTISIR